MGGLAWHSTIKEMGPPHRPHEACRVFLAACTVGWHGASVGLQVRVMFRRVAMLDVIDAWCYWRELGVCGSPLGTRVGETVGASVGSIVGAAVGSSVGACDGKNVGSNDGATVGADVGTAVG